MSDFHAFAPGAMVNVYNETMAGKPIFEGRAVILRRLETEAHYLVRFSDGSELERFVYPGPPQGDPAAWLAMIQESRSQRL